MPGSIRLYGGPKRALPALALRAPGYCTDTDELYIGSQGGNVLVASRKAAEGSFDQITLAPSALPGGAGQLRNVGGGLYFGGSPLGAKAHCLAPLDEEAQPEDIIAAYNSLLAALKAGGLMEETI